MASSNCAITGCTFFENTATHAGGAITMSDCAATITSCNFQGNTANYGGAIDVESMSVVTMQDCQLKNNGALYAGGGVFVWQNMGPSSLTVSSSVILDNQAPLGADGYADINCQLLVLDSTVSPDYAETFDEPGTILIDSVVATEPGSWGSVKACYR
jgi:predicted outer membrane repeat protein